MLRISTARIAAVAIFAIFTCIYFSYAVIQDYCSIPTPHSIKSQTESWAYSENNSKGSKSPSVTYNKTYTESRNAGGESDEHKWRQEFFCELKAGEFALGWGTILLVIVTGGLVWIGVNAEKSSRITARPYLFIKVTGDDSFEDGRRGIVKGVRFANAIVTNHGATPAILADIGISVQKMKGAPTPPRDADTGDSTHIPPGLVIGPGADHPFTLPYSLTEAEEKEIHDLNLNLFCFGHVAYRDAFGDKHRTLFIWKWFPHSQQWSITNNEYWNKYT